MKKILSFITIIIMTFVLFACGEEKISVSFNTNGGSEISKMEISLDELGNFVLPTAPEKEGYVFKGWYIDADFNNEFKSLQDIKESITLYAKWEEVSNEVVVSFETNGGNTIEAVTVVDGKVSEPIAPEKEGYVFIGWYTDAELNNEFNFDSEVKESITLYAKWEENTPFELPNSLAYNYKLSVDAALKNLEVGATEYIPADLDITVDFKGNGLTEKDLSKLEVAYSLDMEFDAKGLDGDEVYMSVNFDYGFKAYIKEKILYIQTQAISFDDDDIQTINISMNIETIYNAVLSLLEDLNSNQDSSFDINNEVENIKNKLMDILSNAKEYGLDEEFLATLSALVKVLEPKVSSDDNKTTYVITDAQIKSFIAQLSSFVSMYGYNVFQFVYENLKEYIPQDSYTFENRDEEGNLYLEGIGGWYDVDNNFHSYSEDTEFEKGEIDWFGYYYSYYTSEIYDANTFNLISNCYIYGETDKACVAVFLEDEAKFRIYIFEDEEIKEKTLADEIKNPEFGYIENDIFYISYCGNYIYNVNTLKQITEDEYVLYNAQVSITTISFVINMVSSFIKFNTLKLETNNDGSGFKFDLDLDVMLPEEIAGYNFSANAKLSVTGEQTIETENVVVDFPILVGYEDVTQSVIESLQQLVPTPEM